MKNLLTLLALWAVVSISAVAQSVPPTTWQEADGSPKVTSPTKIIVSNGSMVVNGKTVTLTTGGGGGSGTVTSVAFTGGLISVANPTTAAALTVAGTSGGVPYFSSASTWASSGALTANALMIGGGAGAAPSTTTTGTGVLTALGVNVGTAGAFVVNGGALGTPSSGTVTNLTGTASININGTVGATTPTTGAFTTITASDTLALTSTTAANNKITQGAAINIGTTSTDGIILQNTTAAAAGAQQYSPRLRLTGQGWKTNATAASQTVDWTVEVQPVQGTANPTSNLVFSSQVNGGGYTSRFSITSDGTAATLISGGNLTTGNITSGGFIQTATNVIVGNDVYLTNASGSRIGQAVNGVIDFKINAGTGGTFRAVPDSPTQITADQNNYQAGSGRSLFYRLSTDASRTITGLNPAGGTNQNGELHYIINVGSQNIVLANESASSTAANRFTNSTGADITLAANEAAMVVYDGTSSRWRVFKQ